MRAPLPVILSAVLASDVAATPPQVSLSELHPPVIIGPNIQVRTLQIEGGGLRIGYELCNQDIDAQSAIWSDVRLGSGQNDPIPRGECISRSDGVTIVGDFSDAFEELTLRFQSTIDVHPDDFTTFETRIWCDTYIVDVCEHNFRAIASFTSRIVFPFFDQEDGGIKEHVFDLYGQWNDTGMEIEVSGEFGGDTLVLGMIGAESSDEITILDADFLPVTPSLIADFIESESTLAIELGLQAETPALALPVTDGFFVARFLVSLKADGQVFPALIAVSEREIDFYAGSLFNFQNPIQ